MEPRRGPQEGKSECPSSQNTDNSPRAQGALEQCFEAKPKGKGEVLREGSDVTIIATGIMVSSALEAAEKLAEEGVSAEVINICTIKPLDRELIAASARKTGKVVTAEEHSVVGGLGGAVCEALAEDCPVPVCRIGIQDVFGESGSAGALLAKYGLDGEGVYRRVKEFLAK